MQSEVIRLPVNGGSPKPKALSSPHRGPGRRLEAIQTRESSPPLTDIIIEGPLDGGLIYLLSLIRRFTPKNPHPHAEKPKQSSAGTGHAGHYLIELSAAVYWSQLRGQRGGKRHMALFMSAAAFLIHFSARCV